jgi:hypothetical protein
MNHQLTIFVDSNRYVKARGYCAVPNHELGEHQPTCSSLMFTPQNGTVVSLIFFLALWIQSHFDTNHPVIIPQSHFLSYGWIQLVKPCQV